MGVHGLQIVTSIFGAAKAPLNPLLETEINLAVCATLDAGRRSAEQGIAAYVE